VNRPAEDVLMQRFAALAAARPLLDRLHDADGVYLVGGAVRDLLLGTTPIDLDLVVEGDLDRIGALLGAPTRVHDRFGTCTVVLAGRSYDLARARRERYARPGALPTVEPATIDEDLSRRDFTVNALALALGGRRRGELLTLPGARDDLRLGLLRVLHDASFIDDPTRLLRLARYRARLEFTAADRTRRLAEDAVAGGALATVTGARLGAEIRLLGAEPNPIGAFAALRELGVDEAIADGFGLRDPGLADRALALLPGDGDAGVLIIAIALIGVPEPQRPELLDRLAFPAAPRDASLATAGRAPAAAAALERAATPSQIAAAVGDGPVELVALAGALGSHVAAERWLGSLRQVRLEIDGNDLLAAGIEPGPAIGAGLRGALAAKLDGTVNGRAQELAAAVRAASTSG
jgi:tRNA nucleotidyltransferase (CCA-adding enzyme)